MKKSLRSIRHDLIEYINDHPHCPEYMKQELKDLAIKQMQLIGSMIATVELTEKRTMQSIKNQIGGYDR